MIGALAATLALAALTPIPIHHDRDATALALAGSDVIVLSEHYKTGVKVVAVPRTGGRARTLLRVHGAGLTFEPDTVAASAQRVAVMIEADDTEERQVYSGPPSGPLRLVRRPDSAGWTPMAMSVDGDRLLVVEGIPSASG